MLDGATEPAGAPELAAVEPAALAGVDAAALVAAVVAEDDAPAPADFELDEHPATASTAAIPTDMVATMRRFICVPLSRVWTLGGPAQRVRPGCDWFRPIRRLA